MTADKQTWLQVHVGISAPLVDRLESLLDGLGAVSITLENRSAPDILEPPVGETPMWKEVRVSALFNVDTDRNLIVDAVREVSDGSVPGCEFEILNDRCWERECLANFQPIPIGEKLWICPGWLQPPRPDAINLILDPGLAFGTGSHPTTALCLGWLEQQALEGKTVIDFGCGSGILGIAAVLMGARRAICIDNDPQALVATNDNAGRNDLGANRIYTCTPEQATRLSELGDYPDSGQRILVANILAEPLTHLAQTILAMLGPGSNLALSGILDHQAETVLSCYRKFIDFEPEQSREDWKLLSGLFRTHGSTNQSKEKVHAE